MITLLAFVVLSSSNYVGAERCQSCHPQAYQTWQQSAHARALISLNDASRTQTRCTVCHTLTPDDTAAKFSGVQCESCHGAGRYYSPLYVMKDKELARAVGLVVPNEQTCKRCHDASAPNLAPFEYAKAWARIAHGKQ
jgi:hypothetical protein